MTKQITKFHFRQIPELSDKPCFLIFKNTDDKPKAFIEFANGVYEIHEIENLSFTDQLLILQEADRYRDSFFDPNYWQI